MSGYYVVDTGTQQQPVFIAVFGESQSAVQNKYPGAGILGPYPTMHVAQNAAQLLAQTEGGIAQGISSGVKATAGIVAGSGAIAANTVSNPLSWFDGLNLGGLLLRIGEVILGVVLVGVGLAKITGTDNVINKAAKTAGMAAIL